MLVAMKPTAKLSAFLLAGLVLGASFPATSRSPASATATTPRAASPGDLKPGEFLWHPEIAPTGPVVLLISLDEQRAYVYRNGIAIGMSTISSGKEGKETPPGVFTILQKNKDHRSNLYNNAPMPYMQRLTWDGIALHGGALPGYPASHGCVRLPHPFAEKVYGITRTGDTVVVANAKASSASVVHPAVLAPINQKGLPVSLNETDAGYFWDDSLSPEGPLSVLVSVLDKRVFVMRNGVAIGEAPLLVDPSFKINGSILMVMGNETEDAPSLLDPEQKRHRWSAYPLLGADAESLAVLHLQWQGGAMQVAPEFSRKLYQALTPGATVLLTDLPAVREPRQVQGLQPVLESDQAGPIPND
jgi:hypothetical protein